MREVVGLVVALVGCGRVGFDARGGDGGLAGDSRADGPADPVPLGPFSPWQTPVRQTVLNTTSQEFGPTLSADGLEVIFGTRFTGDANLWRATRISRTAVFGTPAEITAVNTLDEDAEPTLSGDGTTLVFERSAGTLRLYIATRAGASWSSAMLLDESVFAGFTGADFGPGDLSLIVRTNMGLFQSSRDNLQASWRTPSSLGIAYPNGGFGSMRSDGLEIYWEQNATGDPPQIYRATRTSTDDGFGPAEHVPFGSVFDAAGCGDPDLSEDGQAMVFVSNAVGGQGLYDIYVTTRTPL